MASMSVGSVVIAVSSNPRTLALSLSSFRRKPESRVAVILPVALNPGFRRDDGRRSRRLQPMEMGWAQLALVENHQHILPDPGLAIRLALSHQFEEARAQGSRQCRKLLAGAGGIPGVAVADLDFLEARSGHGAAVACL